MTRAQASADADIAVTQTPLSDVGFGYLTPSLYRATHTPSGAYVEAYLPDMRSPCKARQMVADLLLLALPDEYTRKDTP